jgi:hypothetical protein
VKRPRAGRDPGPGSGREIEIAWLVRKGLLALPPRRRPDVAESPHSVPSYPSA